MPRLIEKREHRRETNINGVITPLTSLWTVIVEGPQGIEDQRWDHNPTDDEIIGILKPEPTELLPTDMAQRILRVAEVAGMWNNLRLAATAAAADPAFTAVERNRLAVAANALRDRLRGLL